MTRHMRIVEGSVAKGIGLRFPTVSPAPWVLGTGLVALDVVYGMNRNCAPDLVAGGTCGNVLAALALLGWDAYPIARLGNDTAGDYVRGDLQRWNVHLDFASLEPQTRTPIIVEQIAADSDGLITHRFSNKCPSCRRWLPSYAAVPKRAVLSVLEALRVPSVVVIDRLSPGALKLAEKAFQNGALVYFEPSANTTGPMLKRMLAFTHVLKYSSERAARLPILRARHPVVPLEIETLGSRGLRYRGTMHGPRGRAWRELLGFQVAELRDTSGAGDWCSAGVIQALAQGGSEGFEGLPRDIIEEGLQLGQAFAAWTCGSEGARGGMYVMDRRAISTAVDRILNKHNADTPSPLQCALPYDVFAKLCGTCVNADTLTAHLIRKRRERPTLRSLARGG